MEFEWNQLHENDRVVIHSYSNGYSSPTLGTVVAVTLQPGHNEVGIRPDGDDDAVVLWPTRLEVHAMNAAASSVCPWCARAGVTFGDDHRGTPVPAAAASTASHAGEPTDTSSDKSSGPRRAARSAESHR